MAISSNHSTSELQTATSAYNFIKIPSTQGASINSTYGISAYPTFILISPNKQIYDQDIWPIDNTILRNTVTAAGGVAQSCIADIETPENNTTLSLYPNPAQNFITIEQGQEPLSNYEIFNVLGEKVLTGTIVNSATVSISVAELQNGNYFIKVYAKDELLSVMKFVVFKE
ncbi:MAG: T9SS type A sorting domain-containing protein [Bacteroidales bacterium]|nr:T9SS type A sorting domain-containing protein [Bacteroidales bacterium]